MRGQALRCCPTGGGSSKTVEPTDAERTPVPLEPEVVVVNMPAPAVNLSKERDIEANMAGRDVDEADGADSDCQIVDENPKEAPKQPQGMPHKDCGD